jgi:hypothetical protein
MHHPCSHPDPTLCNRLGFHVHGRLLEIWHGQADGISPADCAKYRTIWEREAPGASARSQSKGPFDRVVLINLPRRCDRLNEAFATLAKCRWPFRWPAVYPAIDGSAVPCPPGFRQGGGAWGCLQSHRHVLEDAIIDGVENLLVLEDDVTLRPSFAEDVKRFLAAVPADYDGLMLGGQHTRPPQQVSAGVVRCLNTQRTHAYSARGDYLRELYRTWHSPNCTVHCDWVAGPLHARWKIYAPDPFLCGQRAGRSDIAGREVPAKFWTPPSGHEPIILLRADRATAAALRRHGWHSGFQRDPETEYDVGLLQVIAGRLPLSDWILELQWEVVAEQGWILAVWHPSVTRAQLAAAWRGPVWEIAAGSPAEALAQLGRLVESSTTAV